MSWINLLGFAAAFTVLASFCMTTIVSLRSVAIASNLMFILYGMLGHIYPVFFLHLTLRTTLDEVFSDHRFFIRKSMSPYQIVHYVSAQILQGERDLDRL